MDTGIILDDPMDGVELVSRLRHDDGTKSTPSSYGPRVPGRQTESVLRAPGCDVFLPKPCLPNDLLGEVQQLLTVTRLQTADTSHVFQHPSNRTARHAQGWHAAHRPSRPVARSS